MPVPEERTLLGTGIRSIAAAMQAWSDEARRRSYLLRDVAYPVSVDDVVLPPWVASKDCGPPLFISWWLAAGWSRPASEAAARVYQQDPSVLDDPGHRVGYDVCDLSALSLLTNTQWVEDSGVPVADWAAALNEVHLFDDPAVAKDFCIRAEDQVREHAPIVVVEVRIHDRPFVPPH